MKYIKRIILENFQSHKYSIIDLDDRLNVIVGPSDSGKSAIIRGIKWALFNEPAGDYFIREGEKECSVTLEFLDNTIVKRFRSRTRNSYILVDNEGEEKVFEGFGSNIPDEIIEKTGVKKIYLDTNESASINLGEQLEGAFLLSEKTSTRASAIGRLVGVNVIDDALREVLKDSRALNISKKSTEVIITNIKEDLKSYDYLDELKLKMTKLLEIKSGIHNNSIKLEILKNISERLIRVKLDIENSNIIIKRFGVVDKLQKSIGIIDMKYNRYKMLNNLNSNFSKVRCHILENTNLKSKLKYVDRVTDISVKIERLNISYYRFEVLKNKNKLNKIEINTIENNLSKLLSLDRANNIIEKIIKNITQLSKIISLKSKHASILRSINIGEIYVARFTELNKVDNKLINIDNHTNVLIKLTNLYKQLLINNKNYEEEYNSMLLADSSIKLQLEKYETLLNRIEVCPFCLSKIDEDRIYHIITHYIGGENGLR